MTGPEDDLHEELRSALGGRTSPARIPGLAERVVSRAAQHRDDRQRLQRVATERHRRIRLLDTAASIVIASTLTIALLQVLLWIADEAGSGATSEDLPLLGLGGLLSAIVMAAGEVLLSGSRSRRTPAPPIVTV